ncbi:MAG: DNA methyltransferase [Kovacikia sp.]
MNRLCVEDRSAHDWYRFVLSYPPHLVREYLDRFGVDRHSQVLDPFCGTGTTIVECKKLGIPSVGVEANPMAHLASQLKIDWTPDADALLAHAGRVAEATKLAIATYGQERLTLPEDSLKLLLANSISPLPLHKTLVLLEQLKRHAEPQYSRHESLALAKALVSIISNLHFGPEVGVGAAKPDAPVVEAWLAEVETIAQDLRGLQKLPSTPAIAHHADSRQISQILAPCSIDAVITSPPYPNF